MIGLINIKGDIIIPIEYLEIKGFHEGFVAVKKEIYEDPPIWKGRMSRGKWGYINTYGEVVIPLKFDEASDFVNGFAKIKLKNKIGKIDKYGKEYW